MASQTSTKKSPGKNSGATAIDTAEGKGGETHQTVDGSSEDHLTTNHGMPVSDNQNS